MTTTADEKRTEGLFMTVRTSLREIHSLTKRSLAAAAGKENRAPPSPATVWDLPRSPTGEAAAGELDRAMEANGAIRGEKEKGSGGATAMLDEVEMPGFGPSPADGAPLVCVGGFNRRLGGYGGDRPVAVSDLHLHRMRMELEVVGARTDSCLADLGKLLSGSYSQLSDHLPEETTREDFDCIFHVGRKGTVYCKLRTLCGFVKAVDRLGAHLRELSSGRALITKALQAAAAMQADADSTLDATETYYADGEDGGGVPSDRVFTVDYKA